MLDLRFVFVLRCLYRQEKKSLQHRNTAEKRGFLEKNKKNKH